jgi:hypothetical protein
MAKQFADDADKRGVNRQHQHNTEPDSKNLTPLVPNRTHTLPPPVHFISDLANKTFGVKNKKYLNIALDVNQKKELVNGLNHETREKSTTWKNLRACI